MMENRAVIGETDMLQTMQQDALHLAGKALDLFDVTEATEIARYIKKEFDGSHGPGWQCIVGTHFGSFVTHHCGCFIYFSIGSLAIVLFKSTSDTELMEMEEKLLYQSPDLAFSSPFRIISSAEPARVTVRRKSNAV